MLTPVLHRRAAHHVCASFGRVRPVLLDGFKTGRKPTTNLFLGNKPGVTASNCLFLPFPYKMFSMLWLMVRTRGRMLAHGGSTAAATINKNPPWSLWGKICCLMVRLAV